jgi:RNA polymerase sigma-70 factor (sigma-E family)
MTAARRGSAHRPDGSGRPDDARRPADAALPDDTALPDDVDVFYAAAYPRLVGVLVALAGSRHDAEELAQEAFLRLLPRWERIRRYDDPEAWVRAVAFRLATSRWRRARTAAKALIQLHGVPAVDHPPPSDDAAAMVGLLAGLSVSHRQVLVLHHGLDLPLEEVARELHLPVGTVKSRLARARAAARAAAGVDLGAHHD